MDFSLSEEQALIVETAKRFVEQELYPYEAEVEETDRVRPECVQEIKARAIELGLYAANMPDDLGGGGLDTLSMCLLDRELGRASMALQYLVARPSNILQACTGEQRERYLLPTIRGEKTDCIAMSKPGAGSDLRSMACRAERRGGDFFVNGTKHFISHVDLADFVILFAATGSEETKRGQRKTITAFLVDKGTPGFVVRDGYKNVSHRGYHNFILEFDDCRLPETQVLGAVDRGFDVANDWLGATRLQVAAICLGRCDRALELATGYAATRKQLGQTIGSFHGGGFKLADMAVRLKAAELLTYQAAWKNDRGIMSDADAAMAKLDVSEALGFIADEALQIHGGMGLMTDLPLERIWRDARFGAGGAVCYAAGFREAGAMPLIGPNCYGLVNYMSGVALWPDQHGGERIDTGGAIIAQSGNLAINFTMQRRCLPLAAVVTVGNQAAVGIEPVLDACLEDARIRAVGLYVEGFTDLAAFVRTAEKARARRVPLVALKTGRSAAGAKLALSHTASLTGEDGLYDALFRRLGVARVRTPEDFVETLKFLTVFGPVNGNRLAAISCSGAEASIFADLAAPTGLDLPPLSDGQRRDLQRWLGDAVHATNPFDFHTFIWGDEAARTGCFETVLAGAIDLALFSLDIPRADRCHMDDWWPTFNAIAAAAAATGTRTAVVSTLPENMPEAVGAFLLERGVLPLHGLDRALAAVEAVVDIRATWQRASPPPVLAAGSPVGSVRTWDEVEAKRALSAIGVAVPAAEIVTDAPAAVAAAESIGYPVVLKAVSADIVHKTEAAAVILDLHDGEAVTAAAGGLLAVSSRLLVEAMVTEAVAELIVGIDRDPQFGPYLVVGFGGVTVELISDSRLLLLPLEPSEVGEALSGLRTAALLEGYRSRPPGDVGAVIDAVLAVGRFVGENFDTIAEIDINPLMVRPQGRGAVAVDAYIRTVEEEKNHG